MSDQYQENRAALAKILGTQSEKSVKNLVYTSIHLDKDTFVKPQFEPRKEFTDTMIFLNGFKMMGKIALITLASAGFGFFMGLIMSSFEFNRQMHIDTDRSTRSQLKQQFYGYGRFLKKQSLGFMKFGFYISLIELPLEIALGKITAPAVFFSGGLAAVFLEPRGSLGSKFGRFMSSGAFIGMIGLYMNKGNDKA